MKPRELFRTSGTDGYSMVTAFMSDGTYWYHGEATYSSQKIKMFEQPRKGGEWRVDAGHVMVRNMSSNFDYDKVINHIQVLYEEWKNREALEVLVAIVN